jgi:diguanylate cyclase (GGDEF)-like protein
VTPPPPTPDAGPPAGPGERSGPILDVRVRWRAGYVLLGLAGLMTLAALPRPLAAPWPAWARFAVILVLGLGVGASALLASLRGRGFAETAALYAFLVLCIDAFGQLLGPEGWPVWPAMALLVASVAVAERLDVALGVAALASLLGAADAARSDFASWRDAVAAALGYAALALSVNRALLGEQHRLRKTVDELARLKYGIGQLEDGDTGGPGRTAHAPVTLRQVSDEGRRARQADRALELQDALGRLMDLARRAVNAHSVLHFEVDRSRDVVFVSAASGPGTLVRDCSVPIASDPFAFVLDRRTPFYATDFKRLLWSLPYYSAEVKVGSLLAMPVLSGDVVTGVLVADRLEIQSFTGTEPDLLESFAALAGEALARARASQSLEDHGAEFAAIYPESRKLAAQQDAASVRRHLLRCARELVPFEAAAIAVVDEGGTRYAVETASGWAHEFEGREVGLTEKTWTAWVIRSAESPVPVESLRSEKDRMPVLVLDEEWGRAESLLAIPLRSQNKSLGALVLVGRRGSFGAAAGRVLELVCNQAAAALKTLQVLERTKNMAVRDGLTGLYNRREFDRLLAQTASREDRAGGRFALLLLDLDHFKKLNDTYGHPAGDAALKHAADLLQSRLRQGDQAARYGGEEFVAILQAAVEEGATNLAERVRRAIETEKLIVDDARIRLTASFGVAVWPGDGKAPAELVAAADRALYSAKEGGRNRVVAASTLPSSPPDPA